MKYSKLFISTLSLTLCVGLATGQGRGLTVKQWQDGYNKGAAQFNQRNFQAVSAYFAPSAKHFASNGKMDHASAPTPADFAHDLAGIKTFHMAFTVLGVRNRGKNVVVHKRTAMSLWTQPGPDKRSHHIQNTEVSDDTWSDIHGKWLMTETRVRSVSETMDGKRHKPSGG